MIEGGGGGGGGLKGEGGRQAGGVLLGEKGKVPSGWIFLSSGGARPFSLPVAMRECFSKL